MYKFKSGQINFSDFGQPVGMEMSPDNRWVKKADSIPWLEIEQKYAKLFVNRKGNVAKPLRLAFGACLIQAEYGYSDEETALMIQESPYLQYFCGFSKYEYKLPFDPSLMVYFRKRLTPEILGEVNELIIRKAIERKEKAKENHDDDDNDGSSGSSSENKGTVIIDATCAPSKIKYPQDIEILNEARENTEAIITELHNPKDGRKPRTYKKIARKDYLSVVRKKKKTSKEIRKGIGKQLHYVHRNLKYITQLLKSGKTLSPKSEKRLKTVHSLYEQQKYMYDNHIHSVDNRIVSLSQPHLRPIVRGKIKAPVEFGVKLDISVCDGFSRLEKQSFDAYNEATTLKDIVERYKDRTGRYPERVLADKIYRNRDNLNYCKSLGIRLSGPALGRPKKNAKVDRKQEYQDICERVEVERQFSLAKQKCGMGLICTRLPETSQSVISLSIIVLNLLKIYRDFSDLFWGVIASLIYPQKSVFIQ